MWWNHFINTCSSELYALIFSTTSAVFFNEQIMFFSTYLEELIGIRGLAHPIVSVQLQHKRRWPGANGIHSYLLELLWVLGLESTSRQLSYVMLLSRVYLLELLLLLKTMCICSLCNRHCDCTIWDLSTYVCDCFWGANESFMHRTSSLKFWFDNEPKTSLTVSTRLNLNSTYKSLPKKEMLFQPLRQFSTQPFIITKLVQLSKNSTRRTQMHAIFSIPGVIVRRRLSSHTWSSKEPLDRTEYHRDDALLNPCTSWSTASLACSDCTERWKDGATASTDRPHRILDASNH
jgi:hypothetical protein